MIASLHSHNEYSLLDGAGTAKQHVEAAKAAGYAALAETNHCTLAGTLHHLRACREGGLMGIAGCEVYYRPNRKVQGDKNWLRVYFHLTLIAKNKRGWRSLMSLVSEAHRSGFYGRACVDDELLEKYSEDVMCLTGCLGGRLSKAIVAEHDREAIFWARYLRRIYGDDLFFEIMGHDIDELRVANIETTRIANELGSPTVVTLDEHYPEEYWAPTQDVLLMIATNQTVNKRVKKREEGEDVYEFGTKTFFHQSEARIREEFARFHPGLSQQVVDESLRNTLVAAGRCTPFVVDRSEKMPSVRVPRDISPEAHLRRLCYEGLKARGYLTDQEYVAQLDFELEAFTRNGQVDYMLLVADFVTWCKSKRPVPKRVRGELVYELGRTKKPIMIGPGRGSAGASVAAWCLRITNMNPRKYKTLFERFVNPYRVGLPDIDIDVPPDRVDEAEDYLKVVYQNVVDIIAHSTFGPRAALSDVGRVLSVPYDRIKAATRTIDDLERAPLEQIRLVNPAVARYADEYPEVWENAKRIQGSVARKSEHAGGVLILPGPVEQYMPVERTGGQKGKLLSAFGERSGKGNALISDYGFVKLDVLRVAELTKQQHAVDLIFQRTGERVDLDALEVHDDPYAVDPRVMQVFKDGFLVGVFQWGGVAGKFTRRVAPDNVLELASINAGIRPGARGQGLDVEFAERKHGRRSFELIHPDVGPFMDDTFGVVLYQEQILQLAHVIAGYTLTEADAFRKIVSKLYRVPEQARAAMDEHRPKFIAGAMKKLNDEEKAIQAFDMVVNMSAYAFNRPHSGGYSILAYRDAWLKTYYPREFYAAFLSKGLSQIKKKRDLQKQEAAREMRSLPSYITTTPFNIMPPDVNESGRDYTVVDDGIRLGLEAIKHIGPAACAAIEEHRPFASYQDLVTRVPARAVNITARGALVMSGALDRWGMRDELTEERIDEVERELIGMSLTSVHSIQRYASLIEGRFWTEDEVEASPDGTRVTLMGEVVAIKEHVDRKGQTMCFIDLAYGPNNWSVTVFSWLYAEYEELIKSRRPLMITGLRDTYVKKGSAQMSIKVESLPPDADGNWTAPILDIQDYIEMIGDVDEELAGDSVFPEDLAEVREPEQGPSSAFAAALAGR